MLRQSKALAYEAPFLYLLFGTERAVLRDTGATANPGTFPLRTTIDALIQAWLAEHSHALYPLLVAHTHAHADHVAAEPQFADRPHTTVVGRDLNAVRSVFHIDDCPTGQGVLALGERTLQIRPIPGHHRASVAVYDPWSGMLLTGDTLYSGRLFVDDYAAFVTSLARLGAFAQAHPVSVVLGCHVEMTATPGWEYALGAIC